MCIFLLLPQHRILLARICVNYYHILSSQQYQLCYILIYTWEKEGFQKTGNLLKVTLLQYCLFCQILSPCFSLRLLLGLPWWPQRHMSLSDTGIDVWTPERQLVREGSKIIRHIPRKGVSLPSSLPWPHCSYTFPLQAHTTTVVWLALVSPFNIQNEQKGVLCKLHNLVYLSLYLYA